MIFKTQVFLESVHQTKFEHFLFYNHYWDFSDFLSMTTDS